MVRQKPDDSKRFLRFKRVNTDASVVLRAGLCSVEPVHVHTYVVRISSPLRPSRLPATLKLGAKKTSQEMLWVGWMGLPASAEINTLQRPVGNIRKDNYHALRALFLVKKVFF